MDYYTTCKLVFAHGTSKKDVEGLLSRHTSDFRIATYNDDSQVGCNRTAFAVVEVPLSVMPKLSVEPSVRYIDHLSCRTQKPTTNAGGGNC